MRNVEIYVGGDKFLTDKVHDDAIYETNIKLTLKVDQNIFKKKTRFHIIKINDRFR